MTTPDPLDQDHRKLYPKAELPKVGPIESAVCLAPPTFFFPGPHNIQVAIDDKDVDRQIQVSILEELRGLRQDLWAQHQALMESEGIKYGGSSS